MGKSISIDYQQEYKSWRILGLDDQGRRFELVELSFPMASDEFNDAAEVELAARRIAEFAGLPFDTRPLPEDS